MKKLLLLIIVSLMLAGVAKADSTWTPVSLDPNFPVAVADWNDPANWSAGLPVGTKARLESVGVAECRVTSVLPAAAAEIAMGGDNVLRIMDGGDLGNTTWFAVGYSSNAQLIVERGGVADMGTHLWIAAQPAADNCIVDINGGTIIVGGNIGLGTLNAGSLVGGNGFVNVNAGLLSLDHWNDPCSIQNNSVIDISFGTVELTNESSDQSAAVLAFIAAGKITGFGGATTPVPSYNASSVITTITAPDPMVRYPTMDEWVVDGSLMLTWENLTPIVGGNVWVDVWYGPNTDPCSGYNKIKDKGFQPPGAPSLGSIGASASPPGTYYWQIDTYAYGNPGTVLYDSNDLNPNSFPIIEGTQIVFYSTDDSKPSVVLNTMPTVTWEKEPTLLTATIYDDDTSDVTITWTSNKDPNATFNPVSTTYTQGTVTYPLVSTTNVTVDSVKYGASHQFTVTAWVKDELNLGPYYSAPVGLDCAENPCQAARAVMGEDRDGDVDENCVVELADLLRLVADWLAESYALTGPTEIPQ